MIEPNTLLYIKKTPNISTDLDAKFYQTIKETLISSGYEHYEISNFAKKGYKSMHNLTYWLNNNYYGFGLGASGFIGNVRYQNRRNLNKYLAGDYILEKETLTTNMDIENTLILGLRMTKGISLVDFSSRYQKNLLDYDIIKKLLANKSLKCQAGRLFINDEYLYIENQILVQLMGEKYE